MNVVERIAGQVRARRESLSWSQTELADMVGTKQSAICRLECMKGGNVALSSLESVAEAMGCELVVELKPRVGWSI